MPRELGDPAGGWVAVVGARPNFVKLAPLVRAARGVGRELRWVHTAQHEAPELTRALWRDLELTAPAVVLPHVPPGPRRAETMARALAEPLARLDPGLVVVVGDVDSTVAGALAARALGRPLAHVEAGLRSFERGLPEERNRRRVDRLSDLLHASEPAAAVQLRREGFAAKAVHQAGNVLADAIRWALPRLAPRSGVLRRGLPERGYGVVTLHRGANVDDRERLERFAQALARVAQHLPLAFPLHPRTAARLGAGARRRLAQAGVCLVAPQPYRRFIALLRESALAITDSGGLPVEASLLGVPCVTLRSRYENQLTLTHGTNRLAGADPRRLAASVSQALSSGTALRARPPAWDGQAARRIVTRWCEQGRFV